MFKRVLSLIICIIMLTSTFAGTGLTLSANTAEAVIPAVSASMNEGVVTPDRAYATHTGTCGDNLTWSLDNSTGVLNITGTGNMYHYSSSSSVNGSYHTTAPWGSYDSYIKSVIIGDSVTSIGNYAFYECDSLTSVTIPDSVTSIGSSAFYNCTSLTSVTIPDSVTSIGNFAFESCDSLKSVTIGNSVTSIGDDAFYNTAYYNNSSNWENNVLYIGNHLIRAKSSFSGDYSIIDGTLTIAGGAFSYCYFLTSVTIPDSVTSISYEAFERCTSLTSVTIPDSVTSIGYEAFYYCTSLTSVTIPDSVTIIGGSAFESCTSLTSVTIPDSVTSIGNWAFSSCTSLTSVTVPDSVTSIGDYAFHYYSDGSYYKLNVTIKCYENSYAHTYATENGFVYELLDVVSGTCGDNLTWDLNTTTGVLTIDGEGDMYEYAYAYYNGESITTAPWGEYWSYIKTVVISDSATSIGSSAFWGCNLITSVTIGNSVSSIGNSAFYHCNSITSVNIIDITSWCNIYFDDYSANPLNYGNNLYLNGEIITDLVIPATVTKISDYAFYYCTSLETVIIPDSVTSIGDAAFAYCDSLTSVTIGNSVTSIGDWAFYSCTSLTSVTIGNSVTSIGDRAFFECASLTSVTIPDSVTSIGFAAFAFCDSLTSVTIPDSVTSIGDYAFYFCDSLTSVTIPDSVTSIGDEAFHYYSDGSYYKLNVTIKCYENSYAHAYAVENGFACELLDVVSGTCGDNLTWTLNTSTGVLTIKGTGEMYNYLPKDSSPYTTAPWGSYYSSIKSVIIGDSVTSIGRYAFYKCTSLTSVTIPDSVTSIGSWAFYDCTSLTSVTLGSSVTSIGNRAFSYCTSLTSMTIPDSVTSIGDDAFSSCTSLTSVTIPDSVTSIGSYAFAYCSSLTSVTIPDSVTSLGHDAFNYCKSLTSVTIGNSVTSIGGSTFSSCDSLVSIAIPDSVTSIRSYAFAYCYDLNSVTIGNSVTKIDSYAFEHCKSLTSVILGNSVKSIGDNAFFNCKSLTCLTIPDSVTGIGIHAFHYYDNGSYYKLDVTIKCNENSYAHTYAAKNGFAYELLDVVSGTCGDNLTWSLNTSTGVLNITGTGEMYDYQYKSSSPYTTAPWGSYYSSIKSVIIGDSVTSIGDRAFYSCTSLASLIIPDSVTSIGYRAFRECTSLTSVTIGNSVTSIGNLAFYECTSLTSVTIPDSVTSIGSYAFEYCTSLKSVTIPDSVTSIGSFAFYYCTSLTSVTIPDSVTSIGSSAFSNTAYYNNSSNWENNVLYIGNHLIKAKSSVSGDYSIKDGTLTIAENAFDSCTSLKSVTIPDSVTSIGSFAFYKCTSLKSVTIPDSVTSIGDDAFAYCYSLTSVTIPDSVASIGDYAFHYYSAGSWYKLNVTIKCYENSYAHTYAKNEGFKYELICDHIFTNYIPDNNATCTEDGTKTAYCDNGCGETDTITDVGSALGHTWSEWIVTIEPTYTAEGEMLRFCLVCNYSETEIIPTLKDPNIPEITVDNFKVTITNAEYIKDMRYAPGEYTTTAEIKAAEGNVAISESLVVKYTVDGSFVYDMPNAGYYTIWLRMKDGTNYILPLDVTKVTPTVSTYGVKITLHNLYNVKDFYIAKGEYQTYREIKDNGYIVSITGVKIGSKHDYTYTVYEPGVHTILVRYNDGSSALFHETLVVDEPVFTTNGLQVTISNLPDVKVIRTAYGEWNTVKELKATDTIRNFSAKTAIKGRDPYTIQYREDGMVTIIVEYNNGYQKVFHYDVQHKQANIVHNGSTVLFNKLDGFVMIRYAPGEYTTSAEIKRAPGAKYIKPADLTNGYAIVSGLAKGTYTFCVQFDDESFNFYYVTVA